MKIAVIWCFSAAVGTMDVLKFVGFLKFEQLGSLHR